MVSGNDVLVDFYEFVDIGEDLAVGEDGKLRKAGPGDVVVGRAAETFKPWPEGCVAVVEERDASD